MLSDYLEQALYAGFNVSRVSFRFTAATQLSSKFLQRYRVTLLNIRQMTPFYQLAWNLQTRLSFISLQSVYKHKYTITDI